MTQQRPDLIYAFGQWQIHLGRRELLARGVAVPIGTRTFQLLEILVRSAGELVTKDALMDRVWSGTTVAENTLHVHIGAIRKALGRDRTLLKTVSRRGYRLLGNWSVRQEGEVEVMAGPSQPSTVPARTFRTNLPETLPDLVGRTITARQIQDALSSHRATTLTGPGGIGKTALALHVSQRVLETWDGEVWLVELASLTDARLVPRAVASVLSFDPGGGNITAEAVAHAIGNRPMLLVLDNCEHVIDAAAALVETILRLCARTCVLATSQELLRIAGEAVYRVPPLEVPCQHRDQANEVLEQSAVQLFVARLRALNPSFVVCRENVECVVAICRRLDGIPLAIEFAAARAATLGVRYVASHLEDRFGLLTGGSPTAPPRHQTLRATLDWSYGLLPEGEQLLLRRLAIFDAGFTLDEAADVMSDAGYPESSVPAGVAHLVEKSFVIPARSLSGGRWALPETIRAYALGKLVESGEAEALRCAMA